MIPALTIDMLAYITAGLVVLVIALIIALMKTNKRVTELLRVEGGISLEDTLRQNVSDLEKSLAHQRELTEAIHALDKDIKNTISGVGVVRFNPFEGSSGSNQSFAVALINKHGDGVIFSSLYSRERVSVFAKPLAKFVSQYELTEEETKALGKARGI